MEKITAAGWECEKSGDAIFCESGDTGVSMFKGRQARFTHFKCDKPIKVNGKIHKNKCGVELD